MEVFDVIIIGAGASGLMAAIHAAKRGRKLLVIDHADQAGRKLLVSGGGKCNITNRLVTVADYYGTDTSFCKHAIKSFPSGSVIQLLESAKIETEERALGRIFCKKGAHEIVSYLVDTAKEWGVRFLFNSKVLEVTGSSGNFCVKGKETTFETSHLLLATGGLACPQIGATNYGYVIAEQFGHTVVPMKPVLAGFVLSQNSHLLNLQGISLHVKIQIKGKDKIIEEPLLFTHQGLSGPGILQVSCFWEKGDVVLINFLSSDDLISQMHKPENGRLLVKNLVMQFLPERLVKALISEPLSIRKVAELSKSDRIIIAKCVHQCVVVPETVEGYAKAEATLGGVSTHAINPKSMESMLVKGLFFAGEVIDITGRLGGYNIHWAFASGFIAGQNL